MFLFCYRWIPTLSPSRLRRHRDSVGAATWADVLIPRHERDLYKRESHRRL